MDTVCTKCEGCGQVANTECQEPWTAWESLPAAAQGAIRAGLVRPVVCPECGGSGKKEA